MLVAGDNLRAHDGRHVGRFHDDEIYGPDGYYLGEIGQPASHAEGEAEPAQEPLHAARQARRLCALRELCRLHMYAGYQDLSAPSDL